MFKMLAPFVSLFITMSLCSMPSELNAAQQSGRGNMLFILDASGSMWGEVGDKPKIATAKEVMIKLIGELPDGMTVGLMAYGHRRKDDCTDIEIVVPLAHDNGQQLITAVRALNPKGMTPITGSLKIAGEALKAREEKTTIILVSDGKETCEGDPCAVTTELEKEGIQVTVNVIGFDVNEEEKQQLTCIAKAGKGRYFTAQNAEQLSKALVEVKEEVTQTQPPPKVVNVQLGRLRISNLKKGVRIYDQDSGQPVAMLTGPKFVTLAPGTYKLEIGQIFWEGIEVPPGDKEIRVGYISAPNLQGGVGTGIVVEEQKTRKFVGFIRPGGPLGVPPGTYRLKVGSTYIENVVVSEGETVDIQF